MPGNILGQDGKYYETAAEAARANAVVENQKRIEKNLEEQNNLIKRQNENNYNIAMEKAKIEQENINMQKEQMELEKKKLQEQKEQRQFQEYLQNQNFENEKELRLLKLFDEVSIPYECFKNFKNELLKYDFTEDEQKELKEAIIEDTTISNAEKEEYKVILPLTIEKLKKVYPTERTPLIIRSGLITEIKDSLGFNTYKNSKQYTNLMEFCKEPNYNSFNKLDTTDFNILTKKQEVTKLYDEVKNWKQQLRIPCIVTGVLGLIIILGINSFFMWLLFICAFLAIFAPIIIEMKK